MYGNVSITLRGTTLANNSALFANLVSDRRGNANSEPFIFSDDKMDLCVLNGNARSAANYR